MQRFNKRAITTEDGTSTLYIEELKELYHSRNGALTESEFVYINKGLKYWSKASSVAKCRVLEIGYGTGLIAFLTYLNSFKIKKKIDYTSLEAYPVSTRKLEELNYNQLFKEKDSTQSFEEFSKLKWELNHQITPNFSITKKEILFEKFIASDLYDIIFYDAFGAHAQPEIWAPELLKKCFDILNPGGVWVSYCAKGSVRRGLKISGFEVQRLPGPPGKREMLRAIKT